MMEYWRYGYKTEGEVGHLCFCMFPSLMFHIKGGIMEDVDWDWMCDPTSWIRNSLSDREPVLVSFKYHYEVLVA